MLLPTDAELVNECAATYTRNDPIISDDASAVRIFAKAVVAPNEGTYNIFAIEGTHNLQGWLADFLALHVWDHPGKSIEGLGWVHAGFFALAQSVYPKLAKFTQVPYAICGHSLGAALAVLLGATFAQRGNRPIKIGAFAPPRVGDIEFVRAVTQMPFCAYRFGNDPVPEVPFHIPFFFPYENVPLVSGGAPKGDPFKSHAIANYVALVTSHQGGKS